VAYNRETNAKIVHTVSSSHVRILRGHSKSVKHITFHPNGNLVTTSCSDGSVYVFSITSEEATLLKKIEGIIPAVDVESETSSKVAWHPDGSVFAAPTESKGNPHVRIMFNRRYPISRHGWLGKGNHLQEWPYRLNHGPRLVLQWSLSRIFRHRWKSPHLANKRPNHPHDVHPFFPKLTNRYTAFNVVALAWHPTTNTLSFTTSQGQLYRWKDCIPSTHPASFGSVKRAPLNNHVHTTSTETSLSRSPSILSRTHEQDEMFDEDDDFIVDDDGAGYVPAHNRKRNGDWGDEPYSKRGRSEYSSFRVKPHAPFQSGSTPWKGNRRYLSTFLVKTGD
jgi:chromosome transmission fidelity protein 4